MRWIQRTIRHLWHAPTFDHYCMRGDDGKLVHCTYRIWWLGWVAIAYYKSSGSTPWVKRWSIGIDFY